MAERELKAKLTAAIRSVPEPPYPSDGAEDVADALLPVVSSWEWLMGVLAEHYPPEVFDGSSRDAGPQIVALTRTVAELRSRIDMALDLTPIGICGTNDELLAVLAGRSVLDKQTQRVVPLQEQASDG